MSKLTGLFWYLYVYINFNLEQEMDGEAICAALASIPGAESLRDVVPKLGLRLKVYRALKAALDKQYSEQVSTCTTSQSSEKVLLSNSSLV